MSTAGHDAVPREASTRFRAPTYVTNVIERRRLLGVLKAGADRQLTVIHAPAGYGKTTLAVQWLCVLESGGAQVAWLGLHRDDNEPHWFLSHLLQAVRRVLPALDATVRELTDAIEQNAEDMQGYTLSALLERIGELGERVVLTFDDWHVIDHPGVHRAMMHLLERAPHNLSVVLTSRTRPQLPLSRLRVRQQLTEIDADRLRFDLDEASAFLIDLNGLRLEHRDVVRLSEGTDGWVAALQLASISLRDSADPAGLIRGFSGRHHSVGEYLAENVLGALPAEILDFLLATSLCDRLCGELAGALTGRADGQAMLEELERRDLFLRPLDDEREWFRYHHLFADYLRRRLRRDHPERVPALHRKALAWFAAHDLVSEAVGHALAVDDLAMAADLVQQHAMPLVEHSRMVSLLSLTGRLPPNAADERPELLIAVAWANCLLQRGAAAEVALEQLRAVLPAGEGRLRTEADVVQACIDIYSDRTDRARELVAGSLQHPRRYLPWVAAVAANIQTFCDVHAMRFDDARRWQRWARPYHDRTAGPFAGVYGRCFAGIAAFAQLDVAAAEEQLRDAVALARRSAGQRSHAARLAGALLGELHYARGQLDEAERLLAESTELGAESGVVDFMIASYVLLARLRARRGATAEATQLLADGAQVAARLGLSRLGAAVGAEQVTQLLAAGRVREARRVADELPDGSDHPCGIGVTIGQIRAGTLAAVASAEGAHDTATALLTDLVEDLSARGQARAEVTALVQLAVVADRGSRQLVAERTLATALGRALPAGLPQLVLDGGPEVPVILGRLRERAMAGAWPVPDRPPEVEALTALLATTAPRPPRECGTPLSGREIEILRMLDDGRTNQQIARALTVTVNTVKWYLKNIYTKLEVANRTGAVSVARRNGLLG